MSNKQNKPESSTSGFPTKTDGTTPVSTDLKPIISDGRSLGPVAQTNKTTNAKAKIFVLLWVLLVVVGGIFWFVTKDSNTTEQQVSQNQATETPAPISPIPFGVIYLELADTSTSAPKIHIKSFGAEKTETITLKKGVSVTHHAVYQEKILYVTERTADNESSTEVWLSLDGGKSVEKLYEVGDTMVSDLPNQVTSAVFSRDGKSVLLAVLPAGDLRENHVKQIELDSKKVTEIFTSKDAGVFLAGFDTQEGRIHYYSGCYNCDANTRSKLLVHDVTDGSNKTIYDFGERFTSDFSINSSHTKLLVVKGSPSTDDLGDGPPYNLVEIDLETSQETEIVSSDKAFATVGYRAGDDLPYFIQENVIKGYNNTKVSPLFETENPIYKTYLVSTDFVVGSTGKYRKERVFQYEYATKSITSLQSIDNAVIFGISWR